MSGASGAEEGLRRDISRLGFGAIALNGVIGAGIFALPAVAAAAAGLFSPWLFLVCGLLIMTVVLSLARAASFFSATGGPLAYVGHAWGSFAGFQTGWLFVFSRVVATAANTNLLVTYAGWFWEPLASGLPRQAAITLVLTLLVLVNVIGVRRGVLAVFVFTLLKLLPLSLLVLLGMAQVDAEIFTSPGLPAFDGLGETILVLMYAFVGFEGAVVPAGEARNPRRDIPLALVQSVVVVALLYVLVQVVVVSVVDGVGASETPLVDAMQVLMGPAGAALMAVGAVFSVAGNVSAMMLSAPRMVFAMARASLLPKWFGAVQPRYRTPANAILFVGLLGLGLALSGTFVWLAAMSTVVRLIVYAACIVSLPRLPAAPRDGEPGFSLWGGYTIPVVALGVCCWLIMQASAESWLVTLAFAAAGCVLYALGRRPAA